MAPPDSRASFPVPPLQLLAETVRRPEGRAVLLDRIDGLITYSESSAANIGSAADLIRRGNVPLLYANHQSHADKIALSGITRALIQQSTPEHLSAFMVPVSATLETGDQGEYIRQLNPLFAPLYADRGYGPDVPLITGNDRERRGASGSNVASLRRLMQAPEDGFGLVMFPEATLEGGRRGADGAVNGMQEVTVESGGGLIGIPAMWDKVSRRETVYIPVAISGSYGIYPPDIGNSRIAPEVIDMLLGTRPVEPMVQVSVGEPFTYRYLQAGVRELLGEELGPKKQLHLDLVVGCVTNLLPEAEQGHYGK